MKARFNYNPSDEKGLLAQLVTPVVGNFEDEAEVSAAIKPAVKFGFIVSAIVLLFFGVWAGFAPLDSAAIATGSVVLNDNRKTVQHLEGGIISEILVEDGDNVVAGQPVIHLNSTSANAQQELLLGQLLTAKAAESRLIAERDSMPRIRFDKMLVTRKNDPKIIELARAQKQLFEARKAALIGQINIQQERIMQYNEKIKGFHAQIVEINKQVALITDETATVSHLLEKGLEQKPRLLALQRKMSELKASESQYSAEIATLKGSITEAQYQMINSQNEYMKDVMTELKDIQQQISDLSEKLNASGDILKRTVITAPQAGKITGLRYHTVGGVITPGSPILDIVPQNDKLIAEVHIQPQDIDVVHEGLAARVMLSAYKSRFVPRLDGTVIKVSADKFTDEKTGQQYYLARIAINEEELLELPDNVSMYPGMPVEAFIVTGGTTFLNYLASPVIDSFRRSFKEQ